MNEDRLRDALQSQASRRAPGEGSWDHVRDRADHLHRRRRFAQSAVALVTVIAVLLGGLAIAGTFDDNTDHTVVATPSGVDGEIVAALDHRIVVMTADGEILRTIVDDVDLIGGISVSPDGYSVLFASRKSCEEGPKLRSVSLQSGVVTDLGLDGINALLSPDQKTLAFQAASPGCGGPNLGIGIRDASTGYADKGFIARATVPVAWSPDSRRLLYRANHAANSPDYILSYDKDQDVSSQLATSVGPFLGPTAAFFPDGSLYGALIAVVNRSQLGYSVWNLDRAVPARFTAPGDAPDAIAADANDRLLLHFADGSLQVQQGSDQPRTIGRAVQGAAWLPNRAADVHGDLVVAFDHRIVVMTADGNILRPIVEDVDLVGGISVSPDGKYVYFAHTKPCEDGKGTFPGIARVAVNGGSPSADLVNGVDPLVSPDGARLVGASGGCPGGDGSTSLFVVELSSGKASPAVYDGVARRTPLAWAPDSSRFLYREEPVPTGTTRVVEYPASADSRGYRGTTTSEVTAGTYRSDGVVYISVGTEDGYTVTQAPGGPPERIAERYEAKGAHPSALSFAPDADRLLVQLADGTLQIQSDSGQPRTITTGVQDAAWLPAASSSTATTNTTTTTTQAPAANGRPAHVFALTATGDVIEIESTNGTLLRTVAHVDAPPNASIAVTPDGETVYTERVSTSPTACNPQIVAVDVATGDLAQIATGRHPELSVSGTKLAYVPVDCAQQWERIAVRDVTDGKEATWNITTVSEHGETIDGLSFDPTGRFVLARFSGGVSAGALILDTTKPATAGDATRVIPGPDGMTPQFAQRYLGAAGVLVGAVWEGEPTRSDAPNVYMIDPTTGHVTGILVGMNGVVAGESGWTVAGVDSTGGHLLLVVITQQGSYLTRWDKGGFLTKLADGITAAAWAP